MPTWDASDPPKLRTLVLMPCQCEAEHSAITRIELHLSQPRASRVQASIETGRCSKPFSHSEPRASWTRSASRARLTGPKFVLHRVYFF
jgi:hypothetical protein